MDCEACPTVAVAACSWCQAPVCAEHAFVLAALDGVRCGGCHDILIDVLAEYPFEGVG